ncbi:MAG: ABC transporter permease [Verrucomicrobia bacterium]|nr:ABC transporter permease [Verrucomicrobiota bacterium]
MEAREATTQLLRNVQTIMEAPLPRGYLNYTGRMLLRFLLTAQGLGAFALITLGVAVTKFNVASHVMRPMIRSEISRAGVRLLPVVLFIGAALGFVIIGQTVAFLQQIGAQEYLGKVMVTVVVRELGPLAAALLVLARVGTATVIELGNRRAHGEVEALEALGIDPVHYLVVPRMIGMAAGIFSLTMYLIIAAVISGYVFAFIQDVPILPADYFRQLAGALMWEDFALLALKTVGFGVVISIVSCYQGLAQPLRLEEVSFATTRAVLHSVVACVLLDAMFILVYLVM